jgi:hypothetical protein
MAQIVTSTKVRSRGITRLQGTFTSHTDGSVTATAIGSAFGRVVAVEYDPGSAGTAVDTGADISLSNNSGAAFLTLTNEGTVPVRVRPTCIPVVAAGTAVTPGAGYNGTMDVYVAGPVKLTVAQAGSGKVGVVTVIVDEGDANDL